MDPHCHFPKAPRLDLQSPLCLEVDQVRRTHTHAPADFHQASLREEDQALLRSANHQVRAWPGPLIQNLDPPQVA